MQSIDTILTLDFETFYDTRDYTIHKMTTEEYVRDERFAAITLGYEYKGETGFVAADCIKDFLQLHDWSRTAVLCHHAAFDGLILSHHYGVRPSFFLCTMSMARAWYPGQKASLEALAAKFDLEPKSVPYKAFDGVPLHGLSPANLEAIGLGAAHDCKLTTGLFYLMLEDGFPVQELPIIDMTVQMFTNPQLLGDTQKLLQLQATESEAQRETLKSLNVSLLALRSTELFRHLLEERGVEIEYKNGKNYPIPCFAATDEFMKDHKDDDNREVAALVNARLQVKSNIRETRAARLASSASRGTLPVYLNYFGATRTGRWSGGDATNWQNFPRTGELGECISASEDHTLIVADAAQIECRILNYVAGQGDVIDAFRNNRDIYCEIAGEIYGRAITKEDKDERYFGKKTELSCGYGIGGNTLYWRLKGEGVALIERQATDAVHIYRRRHPHVRAMWREGDSILDVLRTRETSSWLGILAILDGYIWLPNGSRLQYNLEFDEPTRSYTRTDRRGTSTIWGGALTGEVVQALAAVYLREVIFNIQERTGLKPVWLRHDEAVYISRECDVELNLSQVEEEFRRAPAWLPDIPLDCEARVSKNYAK